MAVSKKNLKIYVAGKVSKESVFGTHHWRDEFCEKLSELSGLKLTSLDPVKSGANQADPEEVFGCDCYMISKADAVVVYLSDDISIGGSQEILVAKYFKKPVIGLAPYGGKFNGSSKKYAYGVVHNYKDPFVFSTCDVVCKDAEEVADNLTRLSEITPKDIALIDHAVQSYINTHLKSNQYFKKLQI